MKSKFPEKKVMTRYFCVAAVFVIAGIAILGMTAKIMFVERDYWEKVGLRFVKRNVEIKPVRGTIYSSDGEVLASSLPEFKIFMDYVVVEKDSVRCIKEQHCRDSVFQSKVDEISEGLHKIFPEKSAREFRKNLMEGWEKKSRNWPIYHKRISYTQYQAVRKLPIFSLPAYRGGFHCEKIEQRTNPFGSLARRTIGALYAGKDSARYGLELAYDSVLRGKPGVSHRQKVLNKYINIIDRPQEDGCDIVSTIDVGMQDLAEKVLVDQLKSIDNAQVGMAVLMEVKTGDVKAIVNMERCKDGNYRETKNYAVSNLLEPGSVFKTASFMVAFDDGYLHPNDMVNTGCGKVNMHGREMKDASWNTKGGYGVISAAECIKHSSNVGVSELIDKFYFSQPEKFVNGLYRVGIADPYSIDIPGWAKPNIRHPKKDRSNWSKTALAWMSIGYETQIPPIRTLAFYNGIANRGKMLRPRFVKAKKRNSELIKEYPVEVVRERMCSSTALKDIQYCLSLVTQPKGSGHRASSKYFPVSGKTGTAQIWTKHGRTSSYLVSFVGYFPANAPKYSCIVCIQKSYPASGGGHCGPVFKRIAEGVMARERNWNLSSARDAQRSSQPFVHNGDMTAAKNVLSELHIPYSSNNLGNKTWGTVSADTNEIILSGSKVNKKVVPNVENMGLRDALFLLESLGMKVSVEGKGKVVKQSLPPGSHFRKGTHINISLEGNNKIRQKETETLESQNETTESEQKNDSSSFKKNSPSSPTGGENNKKENKPTVAETKKEKSKKN